MIVIIYFTLVLIVVISPIIFFYAEYIPYTTAYNQKKLREKIYGFLDEWRKLHSYNSSRALRDFTYLNSRISYSDSKYIINFKYILSLDVYYSINIRYDGDILKLFFNNKSYKITNKDIINKILTFIDSVMEDVNTINRFAQDKRIKQEYYEQRKKQEIKSRNKNSNHPKWNVYQSLVNTVLSRREHLDKLPKGDKNREVLENELKAAESRMILMKNKYNF
jgi:hypothetical protein